MFILVGVSIRAVGLLVRGQGGEATDPQERKQEGRVYFPQVPYLYQVSENWEEGGTRIWVGKEV